MTQYNMPEDVLGYIKDLEKRLTKVEKLTRSGNTSVDNGAFIVKKDDQFIGILGDLSQDNPALVRPDGTPQMGFRYYRDDGTLAFSLYDDFPNDANGYHQFVALWDRRQYPIVLEDYNAGYGLSRPLFPGGTVFNPAITSWPVTTSGSFVGGHESYMLFQNPALYVEFLIYCDAGTSGEARFLIGPTQYGPTISGGAGFSVYSQILALPATLVGSSFFTTKIEYRRTAGTGNVYSSLRIITGRPANAP